jgi:hypothetical protein
MARPSPASAVVAAALGALLPAGRAAAQDAGAKPPNDPKAPLAQRINQAIDSGVEWLRKQPFPRGNFVDAVKGDRLYDPNATGKPFEHPTGCTALSLYTLLKCGVPAKDPVIVKGFEWLRKNSGQSAGAVQGQPDHIPRGTYEITALILALEAKSNPHKREKERIRDASFRLKKGEKPKLDVKLPPEDASWMKDLVAALLKRRHKVEGWRYGVWNGKGFDAGTRGDADMSATQLALLALLAAERCGYKQSDQFWLETLNWVLGQQEDPDPKRTKVRRFTGAPPPSGPEGDGERYGNVDRDEPRGWAYMRRSTDHEETRPTGSMTACGLGSILICSAILEGRENKEFLEKYADRAERAWWDGIAWLQEWWRVDRNPNAGTINVYTYYYLYCLERVGDLKGIHLIGGNPWYTEGAKLMVDEQKVGGLWERNDTHDPKDLLNTCFALLFLNRSTPAITGE